VYVVTSDKPGEEKTEPRTVQIGITDGINTVVTGGLLPGAKVVTDEVDDEEKKKKRQKLL
jgi:HlyD family secretion protein